MRFEQTSEVCTDSFLGHESSPRLCFLVGKRAEETSEVLTFPNKIDVHHLPATIIDAPSFIPCLEQEGLPHPDGGQALQ
jgi:hypothetical protein